LRALLVLVFALTVAVVYGQVFSVMVMAACLANSAYVGIFLLLVHALLMRWVKVTRWRLRLKELEAEKGARATATEDSGSVEEQVADVGHVSAATVQLVSVATVVVAAVAALYIWEPLLPALAAFDRVELWTSSNVVEGETVVNRITLATVINVLILTGLTRVCCQATACRDRDRAAQPDRRVGRHALCDERAAQLRIFESALSRRCPRWDSNGANGGSLPPPGRHRLRSSGDRGQLHQRHHHSFERPVRVGDIVTVGDKEGTVTKIRIRATTDTRLGRQGAASAEQEFITGRLLNWTLSDTQTRIVIRVGIALRQQREQALQILRDVVRRALENLAEPAPLIVFENFGDNAPSCPHAVSSTRSISG
jgi:potassium efflux system protein